MTEKTISKSTEKKKQRRMFNFIANAVDKVFSQVYDGEPIKHHRRHRADSVEHILEEEVLFCKNNVCVHTVIQKNDKTEEKHNPGYLCLKKVYSVDSEISDLVLSWVPNSLLTVGSAEKAESSEEILDENIPNEELNSHDPSLNSNNTDLQCINDVSEDSDEPAIPQSPSKALLDFETKLGDVFSINLVNMKTIKLFYTEKEKDHGQFVIGSPENEYKVFHFHTAGLVKVTEIFNKWKGCHVDPEFVSDELGQQTFYVNVGETVCGENGRDLHPEEGRYRPMNMIVWQSSVNQLGQIEDGYNFRKHVFFGGLSQEVRPDAWKYLLYLYPIHSTEKKRENIIKEKTKEYEVIHNKRLALSGEAYENFWKQIQFTVDKDVVRTDRSHPYYAGQDNPNIQKMRNILLNYAIYNPDMGYTQGMSDLVAPVLSTLHSEVESFWCFVGLMEFSMFATTPTDDSMEKSLGFLRELLRIMLPQFYMHCLCQDYDLNLLFAHRWLVLCFKREFISHEVLKIWEACWSRYQTDYFHIFVCVALVSLYGDQCLQKGMAADEILLYFTSMAMKFDGSAVLKESRALLYKFRQMNRIPCTLRGLLSMKGVWDGGISPTVECASNHKRCCFEYRKKSPSSDDDEKLPSENLSIINTNTTSSTDTAQTHSIVNNVNSIISSNENTIEPPHMEISEHERLAISSDTQGTETADRELITQLEHLPQGDKEQIGDTTDSSTNEITSEVDLSVSDELKESQQDEYVHFFHEKPADLENEEIKNEISENGVRFFHESNPNDELNKE